MIKIGIDIRPALNQIGGIPRYIRSFLKALSFERDFNFYLLCPTINPSLEIPEYPNLTVHNFRVSSVFYWEQVKIPLLFQKLNLDIFHSFIGRGPIRNVQIPFTITIHDVGPFYFRPKINRPNEFFRNVYNRFVTKKCSRSSAKVFTDSIYMAKEIQKIFEIEPGKIQTVYGGVDDLFFFPSRLSVEKFGLSEKKYLLHLSGKGGNKNTHRVIDAYLTLPEALKKEYPLVIAGLTYLPSAYFDYLSKIAPIVYLGPVSEDTLACLYQNALLFIWPSIWEGFGLPIVEAMASGTAVIISRSTSLPEIGGDAAYYVDPYSEKEIAEGIQRLIEDNHLREELITKGLSRANLFTWEKTVTQFLGTWKSITTKEC